MKQFDPLIIERVVPKYLVNQLKLQSFEVGLINAKHTNKVIQILKGLETLPNDTYFLKRVRKNKQETNHAVYVEVLLCLTEQKDQFINQIKEAFKQAFGEDIIKQIVSLDLPRNAPASKKDFELWATYWPCNYIEPQFIKKMDHTLQELTILQELYKVAIRRQTEENSFYLFSKQKYLIHVQGERQTFSCKNSNPVEHPIMVLTEKWPKSEIFNTNEKDFYYLTGLKLLICGQKLCGMCAMALVHSRIQRVYFTETSLPTQQILQIMYSLKLNHKIDLLMIKKQIEEKTET